MNYKKCVPPAKMLEKWKKSKRNMDDADTEFSSTQFEKRLLSLKDSQESINTCCHWCLEHRQHHKKIVCSWLNVLKRVKIEQRLTLFYLANDVIQYSKRKNYEFVESWGTTLQKATTMVRDERVKHKILRIFKIWEQRGVYNEEFIADLSGLISANPVPRKSDDSHEFQSSYLINKIRNCTNLESDTDNQLKKLKEHNPKIHIDAVELCASLKDRAHVDDVEKEIEDYVTHMESYVNALKSEIKARSNIISLLVQAETQLESDRKDVKLVANAYKAFGTRVKSVKKKLDELLPTLSSPIPSPDVNAPSPSPDSDIELSTDATPTNSVNTGAAQFPNAGYYNPVPITTSDTSRNFTNNGFTSFMGSSRMPFDLQNFNAGSLFPTQNNPPLPAPQPPLPPEAAPPPVPIQPPKGVPPPTGVPAPAVTNYQGVPFQQFGSNHIPLLPPPMPPFSKNESYGTAPVYTDSYSTANTTSYVTSSSYNANEYQQPETDFQTAYNPANPPLPYIPPLTYEALPAATVPFSAEEYTSKSGAEAWATQNSNWMPSNVDTPESPPMFEKEGYSDPIEYHDTGERENGTSDVDHRVLPMVVQIVDAVGHGHRGKDVDHRNLISLTGSPADSVPTPGTNSSSWNSHADQDYRTKPNRRSPPNRTAARSEGVDQDYRVPPFNIEQLKLPPPPPPPSKLAQNPSFRKPTTVSPRKTQDNVESIDMDLSDDDNNQTVATENPKAKREPAGERPANMLEPPPPLPDLPEDVDAQNFLDDLDEDLNREDFTADLADDEYRPGNLWSNPPPPPPPMPSNMNMMVPPPNMAPPAGWMEPRGEFNGFQGRGNNRGSFINRGRWEEEFRGRGRGGGRAFRGAGGFRGGGAQLRGRMRGGFGRPRMRGNFRGGFRGAFQPL